MREYAQRRTEEETGRLPDDPDAFAARVRPWEAPLYRHCLRLLGHAADAEDFCQEALLRAFTHRVRYDPRYRLSTWLFTIATRLCLSELRKRQVVPLMLSAEDEASPAPAVVEPGKGPRGAAMAREAERLLVAALARLPVDFRVAVSLFYDRNLSLAEIGEMLEISPGLVKVRLFRAREKLAELLEPHAEAFSEWR